MVEIAIMIEGQNGLNWKRWQRIGRLVEDLGFAGLYRSDHFTNGMPPDLDSLELWTSLTWLAANTSRIKFGPLVTPVSFRHPVLTARMAAAVDDLSKGRLTLGVGAGWQEREHHLFGFDLLPIADRFDRLEEGIQVIQRLLKSDEPVTYEGDYYQLREAVLLPRPERQGGPRILIGGNGPRRTLPLVAKYADEWNAIFQTPDQIRSLNRRLDGLAEKHERNPADIERSMMSALIYGTDEAELQERLAERSQNKYTKDDLLQRGFIIGTANGVIDQINRLAEAGVQRLMLQWLALDDMKGLEDLAKEVLPEV